MKSKINIGTCGFGRNKIEYSQMLSAVEIQQTFYQPPQIKTLERWREQMPGGFEFAVKAWQLITHEAKSPTFRRLKKALTEKEKTDAGYFKPTAIVREAWDVTLACAEALRAKAILFQCPASFKPYRDNIKNLEKFFKSVERRGMDFCWEPRGNWDANVVRDLCERLDLWHVVDPLKTRTATPDRCYYRLHGMTGWRYKYEEGELEELAALIPRDKASYVFFNNIYMTEDAVRFQEILEENDL
jgi:uncharacterized protein YecE (DUF72 family)